jgi:hypothetical protein
MFALGEQAMNKLLPLTFALAVVGGSAAYGMPVVQIKSTQTTSEIQVGSGRYNYYRGYTRGYYRGYRQGYYQRYYAVPYSAYPYGNFGSSGSFSGNGLIVEACEYGSYMTCSYGTCWRACY